MMAQAEQMIDMIGYQKGSVVSRQILGKAKGNVTVFAFDEGQGLSEHTAPFDAMVYIMDGEAKITIAEELFELKAGDVIVMPADKPHAITAITPFKMLLAMIKA
jgi:quercetin dioxygenase-like cupin family protein